MSIKEFTDAWDDRYWYQIKSWKPPCKGADTLGPGTLIPIEIQDELPIWRKQVNLKQIRASTPEESEATNCEITSIDEGGAKYYTRFESIFSPNQPSFIALAGRLWFHEPTSVPGSIDMDYWWKRYWDEHQGGGTPAIEGLTMNTATDFAHYFARHTWSGTSGPREGDFHAE